MITTYLAIAALVAWLAFELLLRRPGPSASLSGSAQDRRSTPLLVAAYTIAIVLPPVLSTVGLGTIGEAAWAGVALAGIGLVVRAWAMRTLGAAYSRNLRTTGDQTLVTAGPYRWLRHPGYAGSLAVWVGAALAFHSWVAAVLVAALMLLAYAWRIRSEERMLVEHFGQAYADYVARTARIIPGVY